MKTTPSTLSPLEAYEALMLFARRRGEGALRLAMHAAVPQQFRPDLLHLLKLNFLPRELHDAAAESDVLFSPLCEETGRGYFEFGPHVRTLLLDNLAANYANDRTPRISRVANFLLFYVEHMERRAAGGLDRLWRDYLEVQRWVALAFLDPDNAARQLASALKGTSQNTGGEVAARLRLGGLASALSSPLVKYRHVLNYAAGLQALEAGDHARAQTLLASLGDEELNVGGILLRPATDLLRAYSVQSPEPTPSPTQTQVPELSDAPPPQSKIFLSYSSHDRERTAEIADSLRSVGYNVWLDAMELQSGERWGEAIQNAIKETDLFIVLLSRHSIASEYVREEIHYALRRAEEKPGGRNFIIPVLLEPCEIPEPLAAYHAVNLPAGQDVSRLVVAIGWRLERRWEVELEDKIRALEALAGSDEPGALETLTEAVWREEDARVRLAAVKVLSKSKSETALEALLVAAGDGNAEVYRAAVDALADAEINAVLIYGFFGTDHVVNREVLREELRRRGYVPLIFPFTRPLRRGTKDIPAAARPITRFAIADLTAPPEILEDLAELLERFLSLTRVPLLLISQDAPAVTLPAELRRRYPLTVLPFQTYSGPNELREAFDRTVMEPVMAMLSGPGEGGAASDFEALLKSASSLEEAGDLESALAAYERAGSVASSEEQTIAARNAHIALLRKLGRLDEVLKTYEQAIELTPDDEELHLGRARTLESLGRYADAVTSYETAFSIASRNSSSFNSAMRRALLGRARCLIKLGLFSEAFALLTDSRRSVEEHGHPSELAELLNYNGQAAVGLHRFEEARHHYVQSLEIYRKLGDQRGEAEALNSLGYMMQGMGDVASAESVLRETLRILRELGDERGAAAVLVNLGKLFTAPSRFSEAEKILTQALEISSRVSDREGETSALVNLGSMYLKQGRLSEAQEAFDKALALTPNSEAALLGRTEVRNRMAV